MPRLGWLLLLGLTLTFVMAGQYRQQQHRSLEEGGELASVQGGSNVTSRDTRFAHLQPRRLPSREADETGTRDGGGDDDEDWESGSVDTHPGTLAGAAHRRRSHHPGGPTATSGRMRRNRNHRARGASSRKGVGPNLGGEPEVGDELTAQACPRCELHEEYKRLRLEAIKAEILSRLNLKEPPKMSNKTLPQNPTFSSLIDRFEMAGDAPYEMARGRGAFDEDDSYHVRPLEILLLATTPPANLTINDSNVCYFALNSEVRDAKSIKAEFGVYIKPSRSPSVRTTLLRINKLERRASGIITKTVHQRALSLDQESTGRWYRFGMDWIVKSWVQQPSDNLGLQVEMYDYDGTRLAIVQTNIPREEPYKPYLEVEVKGTSRPKRHLPAPDCTAKSREKRCCRYPLIVDFVAMNWDWILAPKQYKAYYCYGNCPFAYYRPYPHTHVVTQTLMTDFTPCCTASELNQLLLFYRNEEQTIIYGRIPGMIVESCSCI